VQTKLTKTDDAKPASGPAAKPVAALPAAGKKKKHRPGS
jgi:hypothetical protein